MAKEIILSAVTGLTITFQLYSGSTATGSPIAATEIGTTGEYYADMPAVAYGKYLVIAITAGQKLASGEIFWDGTKEITPILYERLHRIEGLETTKPMTVTPLARDAGDIHLVISGDGITSTTVTA